MNKSRFVEKLSTELCCTKIVASKSLDAVLKCIVQAMKDNDELRFVGFGTIKAKQTKAKEVKTPRGTTAKVPAKRQVRFSVGAGFKEVVNKK